MRQPIYTICAVVPALAMTAAHYIPWQAALGRRLHRVEAYSIGTAAIVGTAATLLFAADDDPTIRPRHAAICLLMAAASAGIATIGAYLADWRIEERHRRIDAVLRNHAN